MDKQGLETEKKEWKELFSHIKKEKEDAKSHYLFNLALFWGLGLGIFGNLFANLIYEEFFNGSKLSSVGFAIFICLIIFFFMYMMNKQRKEDQDKLRYLEETEKFVGKKIKEVFGED